MLLRSLFFNFLNRNQIVSLYMDFEVQKWVNKELYLTHEQLKAENRHRFRKILRFFRNETNFQKKVSKCEKILWNQSKKNVIVKAGSYKK